MEKVIKEKAPETPTQTENTPSNQSETVKTTENTPSNQSETVKTTENTPSKVPETLKERARAIADSYKVKTVFVNSRGEFFTQETYALSSDKKENVKTFNFQ